MFWNKNMLFTLFPQTYSTLSYFWPPALRFVSFNLQSGKQQKNRSEEFHLQTWFAYLTSQVCKSLAIYDKCYLVWLPWREHKGLVNINSHGECIISKDCMKENRLF